MAGGEDLSVPVPEVGGGVERVDWNWSIRVRVVLRRTESCLDMLAGWLVVEGEIEGRMPQENLERKIDSGVD